MIVVVNAILCTHSKQSVQNQEQTSPVSSCWCSLSLPESLPFLHE